MRVVVVDSLSLSCDVPSCECTVVVGTVLLVVGVWVVCTLGLFMRSAAVTILVHRFGERLLWILRLDCQFLVLTAVRGLCLLCGFTHTRCFQTV